MVMVSVVWIEFVFVSVGYLFQFLVPRLPPWSLPKVIGIDLIADNKLHLPSKIIHLFI